MRAVAISIPIQKKTRSSRSRERWCGRKSKQLTPQRTVEVEVEVLVSNKDEGTVQVSLAKSRLGG